ncbi:hypothetical protein LX12_000254 [Williamsia serinedens]|uniref:Uncharacterized protein n=1 Tax=Williamsia serinedens TaxID=391736 RepID=A0ABT1GVV4_9NOCA|nr:hypothetical protein [Williamsia serinedens]
MGGVDGGDPPIVPDADALGADAPAAVSWIRRREPVQSTAAVTGCGRMTHAGTASTQEFPDFADQGL